MADIDKDFYKILGVSEKATEKEIRSAYHKLAKKLHPDHNPGDKEAERRFKAVNEAHDTLGDKKKRAQYDQFRELTSRGFRFQGRPGAGAGGFDFSQFREGGGGISDIFDMLFKRGSGDERPRMRPERKTGEEIRATAQVPVGVALRGGSVQLTVESNAACDGCQGTGGARQAACPVCRGTGRSAGLRGSMGSCVRCGGAGAVTASGCPACGGKGERSLGRRLTVKIPAGTKDGVEMRLAGQGGAAPAGGTPGDLFLKIQIVGDDDFAFEGGDLISFVKISAFQAMLGATVEVCDVTGERLRMKVAAGTQPGTRLRLRGRGLGGGDHLVEVRVTIPAKLSAAERAEVERLASLLGG